MSAQRKFCLAGLGGKHRVKDPLHCHHMGAGTPGVKKRAVAAPVTVLQCNGVVAVPTMKGRPQFIKLNPLGLLSIAARLLDFADQI